MKISEFWEHYKKYYGGDILPLTGKPRLAASTMRGFGQIWNQHLAPHFADAMLSVYTSRMAARFLRTLTATQCKTTIKHIRSLARLIFQHAVDEEILHANPWAGVKMPKDAVDSAPTKHYTVEESENIISALREHLECQLIMALSCFLGLRPGEIVGLRWEDFSGECIHIRRAVVRGVLDTPKTQESIADIPLVDGRIKLPLMLYWKKCGQPAAGFLFHTENGNHLHDLGNIIGRIIRPTVKAAGLQWKGLYAGRRGACTNTIEATGGNYAVAQALLRHKSMTTTLNVYKKAITAEAFRAGLQQVAANGKATALVEKN
jgi:integrase